MPRANCNIQVGCLYHLTQRRHDRKFLFRFATVRDEYRERLRRASRKVRCTMVDGGDYAWNCTQYIDLNMVRAGVVAAPKDWRWCGYDELTGRRRRYRLLDWKAILRWHPQTTQEDFSRRYETAILTAVRRRELGRNPIWTESLAVGGETLVARVAERLKNRRVLEQTEIAEGVWVVREGETPYTPLPGAGNAS